VSVLALKAGTDMDMVADGFLGTLPDALQKGRVSMEDIDKAVRHILEAKYKLGLFDDPYKYADPKREKTDVYTAENRAKSRALAQESFVLLKNEGDILPLAKNGKIALIGPLANTRANMPGTWSVAADFDKYKTLLEGFRDAVGSKAEILYAKGSNIEADATLEANASMFGREIRDSRSAEEMLKEAVEVAKQADVIVAAMGETSEYTGESSSRTELAIPSTQRELLEALLKLGKPIVLLNFSGRPTVMSWEAENMPSILNVWFGGSEAADAICDVVFGDVAPSGKLTATMPRSVGQIPIYYNHLNTGRPYNEAAGGFQKFTSNYLDVPNSPLYPFGYGLSYTTFDYSDITLSSSQMNADGTITASVTVTNSGKVKGTEVVQLYIRDLVGSVSRPVKELKGFERITLNPGESRTVDFTISADLLKFYNSDLEYVCEPGDFELMIGTDSENVKRTGFTLK
jgi:beta-glucosidase